MEKTLSNNTLSKAIGAILLITGTAVGGGMLALPVVTSPSGFFPSIFLFAATWLAMTFTAFLLLECNLAIKEGSNLISMSRRTLGRSGEYVAWTSYLLLLYSLIAAYISGASSLLGHVCCCCTSYTPSTVVTSTLLTFAILFLVAYGIRVIDKLNRLLICVGGVCLLFLLFSMSANLQVVRLIPASLAKMPACLPIIVTAFGYHIVLPSLVRYLNRDVKQLRLCLLIGSLIPLILYIVWQLAVMGSIPAQGEYSMQAILNSTNQLQALIQTVSHITGNKLIASILSLFCGMSILTSLLGVSLSLWDFLADGFSKSKWGKGKINLSLFTFGPPIWLGLFYPTAFTTLLGYAGIFVAILLGLLPIAMCWKGRANRDWAADYRAPGGKVVMLLASLFFVYIIVEQILI